MRANQFVFTVASLSYCGVGELGNALQSKAVTH